MAMYLDSRQGPRLMPMDLSRTGDSYVLNADLPGIDPASVDVNVDGQLLSIRAERPAPSAEGVTWIARERRTGTFLRRFSLGQNVDTSGISANYENGVLSVVIPVAEKAKPRKIVVQPTASAAPAAPVKAAKVKAAA
ncbi:MAG: Hsp20/alpha crystallin family protein [Pseudolysinimonas sp.]